MCVCVARGGGGLKREGGNERVGEEREQMLESRGK